jgi:hypothetical protein
MNPAITDIKRKLENILKYSALLENILQCSVATKEPVATCKLV